MSTQQSIVGGTEPILDCASVSVHFRVPESLHRAGRLIAVDDVSLAVRRGEVVGLVGESACGKSTLARVLGGLQRPTRGVVRHRGADLWAMASGERRQVFARDVAIVFQDPASSLNPRHHAQRIVQDPLDIHRVGDPASRRTRVAELFDLVRLPRSLGSRLPGQMSIGQRQRLAIARALALAPSVLIADEPTSALDVSVKTQILALLAELRTSLGLGMVFVSHDIHAVRYLADRIAVMYLGRMVEEGPANGVCGHPLHPYTAALLSAVPTLADDLPGQRIILAGNVPSPRNPPTGCTFRTRCWLASDECASARPPYVGDDHRASCIRPLRSVSEPTI